MILVSPSRGSGARDARSKWLGWLGVSVQSGLGRRCEGLWPWQTATTKGTEAFSCYNQGHWGLFQQGSSWTLGSMALVKHDWKWWGAAASSQFQVHDCCLRHITGTWILAVCFLAPAFWEAELSKSVYSLLCDCLLDILSSYFLVFPFLSLPEHSFLPLSLVFYCHPHSSFLIFPFLWFFYSF